MARGAPPLRLVYLGLGWLFLGLGAAGAVLPVLPTTPFLLLALAAFSRSSARLEAWLLAHPRYGPALRSWRAYRVVPWSARVVAWSSMALSLGAMIYRRLPWPLIAVTAAVMAVGVVYVLRCPTRPPEASEAPAAE